MKWNDIVVEDAIPSLISKEIFDKVQSANSRRIKLKTSRSDFYNLCV